MDRARSDAARTGFHGIFAYLRSNLEETKSEGYREYMMQYMSATTCPRCHGRRLRPESLAVTIPIGGIKDQNGHRAIRASPTLPLCRSTVPSPVRVPCSSPDANVSSPTGSNARS